MAGAGALGIIGAGLSAASLVFQGIGQKRAYEFEAEKADIAARVARVQGDQIDAGLREEFGTTLANIRAIRAVSGAASSPSTLAYIEGERRASDRARRIETGNKRLQARTSEMDAAFLRKSAKTALFGGILGGLAAGVKALA
jgi:hypothetical protein